jgi:hypothetical protein
MTGDKHNTIDIDAPGGGYQKSTVLVARPLLPCDGRVAAVLQSTSAGDTLIATTG